MNKNWPKIDQNLAVERVLVFLTWQEGWDWPSQLCLRENVYGGTMSSIRTRWTGCSGRPAVWCRSTPRWKSPCWLTWLYYPRIWCTRFQWWWWRLGPSASRNVDGVEWDRILIKKLIKNQSKIEEIWIKNWPKKDQKLYKNQSKINKKNDQKLTKFE